MGNVFAPKLFRFGFLFFFCLISFFFFLGSYRPRPPISPRWRWPPALDRMAKQDDVVDVDVDVDAAWRISFLEKKNKQGKDSTNQKKNARYGEILWRLSSEISSSLFLELHQLCEGRGGHGGP